MTSIPYHLQPQVVSERPDEDKIIVTLCNTNNHFDVTVEPHVVDIPDNAYRHNFRPCNKKCDNPMLEQIKC